jgi:hypothetical protein
MMVLQVRIKDGSYGLDLDVGFSDSDIIVLLIQRCKRVRGDGNFFD